MKATLFIACLISMLSFNGQAQGNFSAHVQIAPPSTVFGGGFGNDFYGIIDYDDPYGLAGIGLGIGVEYHHPFGDKGISGLISLDFIRNPIKRTFRQQYKLSLESNESVKFSSYYNAPVMLGIHYDFKIKEMPVYAQGGAILDFLKASNYKETYVFPSGDASTDEEKHNLSTSFGYGVGIGVVLKDKYILGLGYKALGVHTIRVNTIYTQGDGDVFNYPGTIIKKVGVITISAGIQL